jgi:hypothetical protein
MTNKNIKVFGIGLSRTGTLSLTKALTTLGIKTKHYPNDETTQKELKAANYNLSLLNEVQALTDIPVSLYYPQFDRLFPESKFILTTRPTDSWLTSVENHFKLYVEHMRDDFDDFVLACVYGTLHFDAERFRYVKELHEYNVQRYFFGRPEKLLVLDVSQGDGWEKICDFLGCSIPNEVFPHVNEGLLFPARQSKVRNQLRKLMRVIKGRSTNRRRPNIPHLLSKQD